ncbi:MULTISPECIES: HK97 gp10 family phage protein [Mycetocola]|uniref:HK97 gp10 family phage protein n=1 Tax=Mycetocola TaxID=76634 RepID=UPI0004C00298|nr:MULTISPECIES: HK97 gp10 family phage protein [Mycetocola]
MPAKGQTEVNFNTYYFNNIMKSAGVDKLTKAAADRAAAEAKKTAPVDTTAYQQKIGVEARQSRYRRVYRVVGRDPKTLLIEAKTGNLARALKASKT